MTISQTQFVDLLLKKVGYGVAKTDTAANKGPTNEANASPMVSPGGTIYQQDYYISSVTVLPTSNTVVNGSTIVAVHRDSLSSSVQCVNLTEGIANETWTTGYTDWVPPQYGTGYSVAVYTGPASSGTPQNYTQLFPAGSGANDAWYFDYQAGILNFPDTIVPTAVSGNVIYVVGARYTGVKGIQTFSNINVTGNITSTSGNLVLTNGNVYAQNYIGNGSFLTGVAGSASGNVSFYSAITPLTTNQTFYVEFGNLSIAGNTITGVNSALTYNPSTAVLSSTNFSGAFSGTGSFTSAVATNFSTGNALITGGAVNGLTTLGATTGAVNNFSSGNAVVTNLSATTGVVTNLSTGNALVTGGAVNGLTTLGATTGVVTNFSSGNARISGGYADNFAIGANTKATGAFTTLTATGTTTITGGADATSTNTGILQVTGGAGITGNLWVGGNIYAANIIATVQNQITVQDPLLYLQATGNLGAYDYDIGFYSDYTAPYYAHTGLARNVSANTWTFFSNVKSEPSATTINWNDAGIIFDPVKAGTLFLANTTASTNQGSGAIVVNGGAGIAGQIYTLGLNASSGNVLTLVATNFSTANAQITGGAINGLTTLGATTLVATNFSTGNAQITNSITTTGVTTNFSTANALVTGGAVNGLTTLGATTGVVTNLSTGNALVTGGAVNGLTTLGATTGVVTNLSTGNALITGGAVNGLTTLGATTGVVTNFSSGNAFITNAGHTTLVSTNFSTGNALITGGYIQGVANVRATEIQVTNFSTGNALITGGAINVLTTLGATTGVVTNFSSGNALITGGSANGLTTLAATTGVVTNFSSGNITGTFNGTVVATVATANVSMYDSVTALTTNQTFYPIFSNISTSGNTTNSVNSSLTYNPSTAVLTSTNFSGTGASITNGGFTTLVSTNLSSGNAQITGGTISGLVSVGATTGNFGTTNTTTLNATTGNITNIGTSNIVATVGSVGTLIATTGFSTANAVISGGSVNGLTTLGATTGVVTNFSTGNAQITGGTISGLVSVGATTGNFGTTNATTLNATTGNITNIGTSNIVAIVGSIGTLIATTGFSTANAIITNESVTTGVTTNFSTGNARISGGYTDNFAIGANTAATGRFTTLTATGATTLSTTLSVTGATTLSTATAGGLQAQAIGNVTPGTAVFTTTTTAGLQAQAIGNVTPGTAAFTTVTTNGTVISSGNIVAASGTASTSTTTGALIVIGGAGVSGNLNTGANVNVAGATILNSSKTAGYDTIIKGKNDETLIWARPNATYDTVIIGNSATSSTVVNGAKLNINTTDSILIPVGASSQRPGSAGFTDTTGMFRFSTTAGTIEWYDGSSWKQPGSSAGTVTDQQLNGDGTTVAFTLSQAATTAGAFVSINGIMQIPTLAYSISGTTLTFTEAPALGDVIDVRITTVSSVATTIIDASGFNSAVATSTGIAITTGTSAANPVLQYNTDGAKVNTSANVVVASANTVTTIDSFSSTTYRSARYVVQVTNGTNYQVSEALVIHNGTTAQVVEYGVVQTNGNLGVLATTISGGNALLQFIAKSATNTLRITKDYTLL